LNQDPPELSINNQNIPPGLSGVVRRSLEKNPNDRFHSARDLAFALAAVSEARGGTGRIRAVRTAGVAWKIALLAGVLVLGLSLLWIWNPGDIRHGLRRGLRQVKSNLWPCYPLKMFSGNAEQEYFALNGITEVREITRTSPRRASSVISSSVMPSAKYSCRRCPKHVQGVTRQRFDLTCRKATPQAMTDVAWVPNPEKTQPKTNTPASNAIFHATPAVRTALILPVPPRASETAASANARSLAEWNRCVWILFQRASNNPA